MPAQPNMTASELGALWLTYQQKTMLMRMIEYFIARADDDKAKEIMTSLYQEIGPYVEKITQIFTSEGAAVPIGFTNADVNLEAPKLYDNGFDIMFVRLVKEISTGMHALNITMAYREDIVLLFKDLTSMTQKHFNLCTQYLLEKGMLARSPYVSMPKSVDFITDQSYLGGINPFREKRVLNTVEVAQTYHAIETNITGMQMILGFAQCAKDQEVKNYFLEGAELAKGIIKELTEVFLESHIPIPGIAGGHATRSKEAPFSDKIMMYCISLFCSFSLGGNSVGTAFSLRNDLPARISVFMKDIFEYAHQGAKIMIKNGWMEEPPQMEQRKKLIQE